MVPWLWFWAPQLHFPGSGDVAQRIEPNTNWFFDSIDAPAGNGRIEKKAFETASYGKQLGLITEVLLEVAQAHPTLSADAAESLRRLKKIHADIEALKTKNVDGLVDEIEGAIKSLRKVDKAQLARAKRRLRLLLADEST